MKFNNKMTILFIASNPSETSRLRLDLEYKAIRKIFQNYEYVKVEVNWATSIEEIQEILYKYNPDFVHLSAHSSEDGRLLFENNDGKMQPVLSKGLANLFKRFKNKINCVIINACFSKELAFLISRHINYTIGMNDQISDNAALNFSKAFYKGLVFEGKIEDAFQLGINQLEIYGFEEESIPTLMRKPVVIGSPVNYETGLFFNRQLEKRTIVDKLANPTKKIISILGNAGMGKTELANKIMREIIEKEHMILSNIGGVAYLNSRGAGINLNNLCKSCIEFLPEKYKIEGLEILAVHGLSKRKKITLILEKLKNIENFFYILYLDNMEDILTTQGTFEEESDLNLFFSEFFSFSHNVKIFLTSRVKVETSKLKYKNKFDILLKNGLPISDGVELLKASYSGGGILDELKYSELEKIVAKLQGVPLALELFAGMFIESYSTLNNVIEKLYSSSEFIEYLLEESFKLLTQIERYFICFLAIYKKAVRLEAIKFAIYELKTNIEDYDFEFLSLGLKQKFLIDINEQNYIALHPRVQEYAYILIKKDRIQFKLNFLEKVAAHYYKRCRMETSECRTFDDLEPQFNEFNHLMNAEAYNEAAQLLNELELKFLTDWGEYEAIKNLRVELLSKSMNVELSIINLISLGEAYLNLGQRDTSLTYLEKAFLKSKEIGNKFIEALSLRYLGEAYYHIGEYTRSLFYFKQARKIFEVLDQKHKLSRFYLKTYGSCLNWLGIYYRNQHDFEKAMIYHEDAMVIADKAENSRLKAHVVANIGAVHLGKYELDKVKVLWNKSLKLSEEVNDKYWIAHYSIDVGYICILQKDYGNAIKYLEKGLILAKKNHYYENISRALMNQGSLYFVQGDIDKAEKKYIEAREISTRELIYKLVWKIEHNLGNIYREKNNFELAYNQYKKTISYINKFMLSFSTKEAKQGFMKKHTDAFKSIILLLKNLEAYEDEAKQFSNFLEDFLEENFLIMSKNTELLAKHEKNNFRYINDYYIIT